MTSRRRTSYIASHWALLQRSLLKKCFNDRKSRAPLHGCRTHLIDYVDVLLTDGELSCAVILDVTDNSANFDLPPHVTLDNAEKRARENIAYLAHGFYMNHEVITARTETTTPSCTEDPLVTYGAHLHPPVSAASKYTPHRCTTERAKCIDCAILHSTTTLSCTSAPSYAAVPCQPQNTSNTHPVLYQSCFGSHSQHSNVMRLGCRMCRMWKSTISLWTTYKVQLATL